MTRLAEWMYRSSRPECTICLSIHQKRDKEPDCKACGKIGLHPSNLEAWILIDKFADSFFDGKGGINTDGIRLALETSDIPPEYHSITFQKILKFCTSAIKAVQG